MGFLFGSAKDQINQNAYQDPNLDKDKAALAAAAQGVKLQAAPQAGTTSINAAPSDQIRASQLDLIRAQQARASGAAPSVAENQLRAGTDRNIATAAALAASARGGANPALVQRHMMTNVASANQQAASDAATLRAQEQASAEAQLSQSLGTTRSQDVGLATSQAQLDQGVKLANATLQQQTQAQMNELTQKYVAMGLSLDQAQFQAQMDLEKLKAGAAADDIKRNQQFVGGIIQGGANAAATMAAGG